MGGRIGQRKDQTYFTVGGITEKLLVETFDHSRVTELRHAVTSAAATAGLAGDRLDDFVLAVNELLTNAVRHGGGLGRVELWQADGSVICEVSDHGHGLDANGLRRRPAPDEPGGWGLWLAREMTDELTIKSGEEGTTVRIASRLF